MVFEGFPERALDFYEGLRADNSKSYWTDHKSLYDAAVKAPTEALLAELAPEFGTAKFFRPYRDVRFSKDKTPYKDHAAAVVDEAGRGALYVQLSADGLFVAGGFWHTQTDQARRLREAIADDRTGTELQAVLDGLAGWEIGGERLVRLPKPYTPDQPRADLLHLKSLTAGRRHEPAPWLHEPECGRRVAAGWRALQPLNRWLAAHVGPTRTPTRPRGG
jgi:uncharacterized protein (TIGR02453 family)